MIMAKLERITVTMPEEMAAKMRVAVESGEYATTSEIVREALRDWEDYHERRKLKLEQLRAMIAEGEKGPFRPVEDVFSDLMAKLQKRIDDEDQSAA
jgi:antitoxin ParD1/3/4